MRDADARAPWIGILIGSMLSAVFVALGLLAVYGMVQIA